jgi:uncharacterized damage-inducible protein DinB
LIRVEHAGMTEPGSSDRWTRATTYPDMWVDPADDPREAVEATNDERSTVLGYLRRYRLTLEMKCADLTPAQLATRSVPPSTMSLLGLVRHMAEVERGWFRRVMAGEDAPRLYGAAQADADFDGAVDDPAVVADAWRAWRDEVAFAEQFVEQTADLGTLGKRREVPLRDVLVHMVEEYARHCGHADLLRERIDGRVGQ